MNIWIVIILHKRYNFIFIVTPIDKNVSWLPRDYLYHSSGLRGTRAREPPVIKFIKSVHEYELNHIPRACVSDFFPLRYSYRAHAAAEPSASRKMNRLSVAPCRSELQRAPFHAWMRASCIRNAGETSRRRRARVTSEYLTWIPWVLINRRGSISRVTKFHLSD